jgi:D-alanyl-D-alanine carboxypeptidase (penicillin-binding protein 5/6)
MKYCASRAIAVWLCAAAVLQAESLETRIKALIESHRGEVAVAIKHLETGDSFRHNADQVMPTASLIKFPVMVEAYRQQELGALDLDQLITLRDEDKVPGSGVLSEHFSAGTQLSVRDAIRLMIAYSDNTATNLVVDKVGLTNTSDTMEKLGLMETKIHSKVFRRATSIFPERSKQHGLGSTTADETIRLYEMLQNRKLASAAACGEMLDHLLHCDDRTKLAALLPAGTRIAHKGGAVSRVRCDAGIIFSPNGVFVICVLTSNNDDRSWKQENAAQVLCAKIARAAYDHFNPAGPAAASAAPKELKAGASGELVEALQRTLNNRLDPSPELNVDGDFGPVTEAAVVRFQREHKLAANGIVERETWQALGPLLTQEKPVPDPDVVNSAELPITAADPLTGTPFVTCEAWVIGNAATGEVLWSESAKQSLDFASTTKIMTAYLVLKLIEENKKVLEEQVTFSARADGTPGSTAGVRFGEQLSVRELLYGLLLPSGNDASVALAEHFGERLSESEGDSRERDPLADFVAEMNRTAGELGMQDTTYKNPHGLTAPGHVSTAADLLKLAHAAMRLESFRGYVSTRQHGCTVTGNGGYRRNVLWKNTNRLLGIEGYHGVKTGTTRAAGACLVSCGRRGDDELLVVILGAKSSDARYADTRNLFRWAWLQLGHESAH